jgi:hypothetical protein
MGHQTIQNQLMSDELIKSLAKWGIPSTLWRKTRKVRSRTFQAPFGIDSPDICSLGSDYWKNFSATEINYKFNSWGFRDVDFEQYRKENTNQKINICIGDSFTLNIGGPQEHSWPALLSKYFDCPTVNISIDGMSSYYYQAIVNKCKESVNVGNIFLLYNLYDDNQLIVESSKRLITPAVDLDQKIIFLKKHCWVHDAYWQFIPPWAFAEDELKYLYQHFPDAHDYLKNNVLKYQDVDFNGLLRIDSLKKEYIKIAGPDWISYETFCESCLIGADIFQFFNLDIDKKLIQEFLSKHFNVAVKKILLTNRDCVHMNKKINQQLADYFYQQSLAVKLR